MIVYTNSYLVKSMEGHDYCDSVVVSVMSHHFICSVIVEKVFIFTGAAISGINNLLSYQWRVKPSFPLTRNSTPICRKVLQKLKSLSNFDSKSINIQPKMLI